MAKDYARKYRRKRKTRLSKIEEKRNLQQAVLFGFLSVVAIIILFIVGLPALIRMAVVIGEKKSASAPKEKSDTLAPSPPDFEYLTEATNSAVLTLKGYAEEETIIEVILNGEKIKDITVDEEGEFAIRSLTLKEGENKIKARATDKDDNQSDFSDELIIVLDTENPPLEISSPNDGDKFFDKDKEIEIKGKTDKEATVYINGRLATVNYQGSFSLNYELKEGENKIKFTVGDLAGNKTEQEITLSYTP